GLPRRPGRAAGQRGAMMIIIVPRPGAPFADTLRRFKRLVADDGVLRALRARRQTPKPGDRRRAKARRALVRRRKSLTRNERSGG
ncbi:MAG: 30S ribosomal protein S21, partial [Candidatus Rokuibacteriota bacterium]